MDVPYYSNRLQSLVNPYRYTHSLNVAQKAGELAEKYGADTQKAYIAGLIHDICKDMPHPQQLQWAQKSGIIFDSITLQQPSVWHGFAASVYIKDELNITDTQIINAVCFHTTGRADMSLLEKVVYLADLVSVERRYPDVETMRQLAESNLDEAMVHALKFILQKMLTTNRPINSYTYEAYNFYITK